MNTYSVIYWTPGTSTQYTATVQAYEFIVEDGFITFITEKNHALFAVPVALNPVVTQTVSA